jgi:hypothetical protein
MSTICNVFGYTCLGLAVLGIGSTLFGDGGFWGFLVFVTSITGALFWLVLGYVLKKVGRLKEAFLPSTPEAALRRRLFMSAFKSPVRHEANAGIDQLHRLEQVWKTIDRHLRTRLSPTELTFKRYSEAAASSCRWALANLTEATVDIESMGVAESGSDRGYLSESPGKPQDLQFERREHIQQTLTDSERIISALEGLELALSRDMQTRSDEDGLEAMLADLTRLADRAKAYAKT